MINKEIWKSVVGYKGWYSVSNFGRVRRDMPGRRTRKGFIKKLQINRLGYQHVRLHKNKITKTVKVHRLVIGSFNNKCPIGYEVNHKDCDKTNNNISNLEYVTKLQNSIHAQKNGLLNNTCCNKPGSKHYLSKLTENKVLKIRNLYNCKSISYSKLAKQFDVSKGLIGLIIRRKAWRHI